MNATKRAAWKLLAALTVGALLLIAGLGFAIGSALSDARHETDPTTAPGPGTAAGQTLPSRADIVQAPMLVVDPADATGGTPALTPGPSLRMPSPARVDELGVATAFPHTPEGAAAQLAELMVAVLGRMDLAYASQVRQVWFADPDQPDVWPVMLLIQGFLERAGMPLGLEAPAQVLPVPVAAQFKGTDGPDWVVACVLLDITYTNVATARLAYGHCEQMAWTGDRWVIAAGSHPPPAPSTWPGTELAIRAGWRTWEQG